MLAEFIVKLEKIRKTTIKNFGENTGESFFNYLLNTIQLQFKTKTIIYELDNLLELYTGKIFQITEEFYLDKYKKDYDENDIEILEVVNSINGNPQHSISDEVTLLFYVGLYHKIENYENEILDFYNLLNETKFKTLKSIGLDVPNKKQLFSDRNRIRLICNSIKHNNYFPKNELLNYYPYLSIDKKISLKNFEPKEDLELVKNYIKYFNFLMVFKLAISKNNALKTAINDSSIELEEYFEIFTKDENYKDNKYILTYLKK
jgi:hypothetical protein